MELPHCNRLSVPLTSLSLPWEVSIATAEFEELKSRVFIAAALASEESVRFGCQDCSNPNWLEPFPLTFVGLQENREKVKISES